MITGHKSNRVEEIGEAMSRAAGTAQAAGISFERLGAYIATVSETTRQEAGSIGTALNSMMTRMTQIKQKGFSEEDGTKVNDVAKALASVGIELLDVNGEWRRMEDIYAEISGMWDTLTEKEQNYLATTMAMTRQQNTFRIIMQRYDRIEELYETAMNSEGTAEQKMSIWQESYAASQQNLLAEWEQFVSNMDVTPLLIDLNDKLAYTLGLVNEILNPTSKMTPYEKSVQAIKELAEYNKSSGQLDFFRSAAAANGNNVNNMSYDEVRELGASISSVLNRIGLNPMMKPDEGADEFTKLLYSRFYPNGELDEDLLDQWSNWYGTFISNLDREFQGALPTSNAPTMENKEITAEFKNILSEYIKNNYKDMILPELTDEFMSSFMVNLLGGDFTSWDVNDKTINQAEEQLQYFVSDYEALVNHVQFGMKNDSGEEGTLVSVLMEDIDKFNSKYGTGLTWRSIYDLVFPPDEKAKIRVRNLTAIHREEMETLKAQQDEFFASIQEGLDKAELNLQKKTGFKDEVDKLESTVWSAITGSGGKLNGKGGLYEYFQQMSINEDTKAYYEALAAEYGDTWNYFLDALNKGDGTQAFQYMTKIVEQCAKKNEVALTEEEKAIQKNKDTLNAWIESRKKAAETKALTESGFADWIEQIRAFGDAEDGSGLYNWFIQQDEKLRDSFLSMYPPLNDFMTLLLTNEGNIGWMENAWKGLQDLKGAIPNATELAALEKLKQSFTATTQKEAVRQAQEGGFATERSTLSSMLSGKIDYDNVMTQLVAWQTDGTLPAMYSTIEGLETLLATVMVDAEDGVINDTEALKNLQTLLTTTTTEWQKYAEAKTKAFNDSVSSDAEGAALLRRVSAAINTGSLEDLWGDLTEDEQKFIETSVEGFDKYVAGAEDAKAITEELDTQINSLTMSDAIANGHGIAGSDAWFTSALTGSQDFYGNLAKATEFAQDLYSGWESLALIQSDVKMSDEELAEAYSILADATGMSVDALQGPGGLTAAEQALMSSTNNATGTLEILMAYLQETGAIDFHSANWEESLNALANSAQGAKSYVAALTAAILNMPSNKTITLTWLENGRPSIIGGGGVFNTLQTAGNGLKGMLQTAANNYKAGLTKAQSNVAGGRGGGGGGSKDETDNLKSEIEKMIHMMDEVQKIWDHHFDMLEAVRNDFEQDKLLQGVMLYYQKESDAITENNKTLEENLKQIEALLPKQQALVSSMSTTDEEYEKASADLEKLQSAHQKYSKQLVENQTKIKEYAEKIKETRDKIRDMEIDLRNTILKAIQDREALEKSMRDARISMENEVYEAIKRRYEKERDLILDNAKTRKDALNEEKSLLDENLNKRKEAQEQQEKQAQLLQLQQKLVRISADPTRQAERLSIQKQIKDLQDELAWTEAEDEVEAQKESIDNQIKNLDDYMEYVTAYYDDIFEHPKQLLAEVEQIMNMTDTEILDWMKANSEEWDQSSASSQAKMLEGWQTTLREMRGELELYWDEVEYIISQGDDYIIEFLKQNSAEYREAGKLQAEAYVDQWREQLEDLRLAHQAVVDDMQQYTYSTIRLSESSGSSSSGGGGGGGGGGNSNSSSKNKGDKGTLTPEQVDQVVKVGNGIIDGAMNTLKNVGSALAGIFSGKTSTSRTSGNGIINLGSSDFSSRSTAGSSALVNMTHPNNGSFVKTGISGISLGTPKNTTSVASQIKSTNKITKILGFASGGEMDETGFAVLHGKPGRPERVLDPVSTELFNTLVADLHEMKRIPVNFGTFSAPNIDTTGTGNTMFGDINISVETLSSDEDYEEIADRIMEVINERMGRGRAVGGIRRSR